MPACSCGLNLFYDIYLSIISMHGTSPTKRDRSLWHIKRGEIPRPAIVISGHFSTSCTKLPSSRVAKTRIWLVQDKWNVFPACESSSVRERHSERTRFVLTVFWCVGAFARGTFDGNEEIVSLLTVACCVGINILSFETIGTRKLTRWDAWLEHVVDVNVLVPVSRRWVELVFEMH
jgi:hypothetical protein